VIAEIRSVEVVAPLHKKQLLTCLRLADKRFGPLIHFNAARSKDGTTGIVNGLEEESLAKPPGRQEHYGIRPCWFEAEDLARTGLNDPKSTLTEYCDHRT
jgi:hypothetical protein